MPAATRRQFIQSSAALGASLAFLSRLRPVSADEAKLDPNLVRLDTGVEPTVRLLEDTPRDRLVEEVATAVKNGLPYQQLLAALQLAGVRNVQPRPNVGFKFHAVLVINSAHLASLASPDADRWLPIFWALDRFKSAQLETQKGTGWRMSAVDDAKLPPPSKAKEAFTRAMDAWDETEADRAAAALARSASRNECFDLFARYGARDFRDIGHKAIYVANSFRTLDAIGYHHAEPVFRSLAYALLKYDGANPATADHAADQPGRRNKDLVKKIRPDWQDGPPSDKTSTALLDILRTATADESCDAFVAALNNNTAPSTLWDALLSFSAELLMRKTSIVSLHAVTTTNALHYAYQSAADPQTRLTMLLQNAAFLPLFRNAAGKLSDQRIDQLDHQDIDPAHTTPADIFTQSATSRPAAAQSALHYLDRSHDAQALINHARRLVFLKGTDAHDYKYSSAVLEDYHHLSPAWRNRFLATSVYYLPTAQTPDNKLVPRIRAALT